MSCVPLLKCGAKSRRNVISRARMSTLALLIALAWTVFAGGGTVHAAPPGAKKVVKVFKWKSWQEGFHFGPRALGQFGFSSSLTAPPGGLSVEAAYHFWLDHLVSFEGALGLGLTEKLLSYGLGMKVNLLEMLGDSSDELIEKGLQRGILSRVLQNQMLFASLNLTHLTFADPAPGQELNYDTSQWLWAPGIGVQWYIDAQSEWYRRLYIETSVQYYRVDGNHFFGPALLFGFELK